MYGLSVQACGLFISSEHLFLAASPDGLLEEDTIIEVKCPYTARNCKITDVSVPYLERCNGQVLLKKKHPYYAQIQGQLFCSGSICGVHEEYQRPKKTCPPETSMSLVAKFKCDSNPPCIPGCVCKTGYLRKTVNTSCLPMRWCPQLPNSPDFN